MLEQPNVAGISAGACKAKDLPERKIPGHHASNWPEG